MDETLFQENERFTKGRPADIVSIGDYTTVDGASLPDVQVAVHTYGTLSPSGDNAVLVCHALSGDSDPLAWWDRICGPGRAIDPEKYFIIGTNALGGCSGTTGPSSMAPDGKPWGSRFPRVRVEDMARVQAAVLKKLGVERLKLVCGGSMGGMQALSLALQFPEVVENVWMTASCLAHSPMQIGFNEAGRQAIVRDPKWRGGDYPADDPPVDGLAVARIVGHLSYLSESAFQAKFGRTVQPDSVGEFAVESYLRYQADKFTKRFDANSYLVLTRAIDDFCVEDLSALQARLLLTSFTSDWLYPSHQSQAAEALAKASGVETSYFEIDLPYGHDAFLLDAKHQGEIVVKFLGE